MTKRRKRGSGSIYRRKDGRWEGRYVIGYDEDGLPRTKNVLAKTKSECAAKLKALKDSILKEEPERPKADLTLVHGWTDGIRNNASPRSSLRPRLTMKTASTSTSSRRWGRFRCPT